MTLNEKIDEDYVKAYKARDTDRVGVLRLVKTAVKNRLVELRRPQGSLTDEEMLDVLTRQAKQRQDSIEQYTAAHRGDLADKEAMELEIIKQYLPAALEGSELEKVITAAIDATGAKSPADMGKVIGLIMGKYKGQVDGKKVSELVRAKLAANKPA